jgi:hypothetical protein
MKDKPVIVLLSAVLVLVLILWLAVYHRPSVGQRIGNRIDRDTKRVTDFFKK